MVIIPGLGGAGGRSSAEPLVVDAAIENARRVSQRTEYPVPGSFAGRPLVVSQDWVGELRSLGVGLVLPLNPDNRERLAQIEVCRAAGIELVSAVHPSATLLPGAALADGVWVNAGCVVGFKAELAEGVWLNTGVHVDHHNVIERCAQMDPSVVTAGFVTLRECAHVHTGAVIVNRVTVGADAVVGAGSVVLDDVEPETTVVGAPARAIAR